MKRRVVYCTDHEFTRKERKNFKKENPGKRLAFIVRYPNFPIYTSTITLIMSIVALILSILAR